MKRGLRIRRVTWRDIHACPCLDALLALALVLGQHLREGGGGRRWEFPWWERKSG